jgi:ATP-dependent Clp protease ATP-binding subunit ClpX
MSDEYSKYVSQIIIEGHTDTSGSFVSNAQLSQNRALSVLEYIMSSEFTGISPAEKTKLEKVKRGVYKDVVAHDVVKYGLIPEIVGRLPVIVALDNLDESALVRIIREPKNAIYKEYVRLFELDGIKLEFEESAFKAIAHLAIERETGARGLRSIIEGLMMKPMFELPSEKDVERVIVTEGFVKGAEELTVIRAALPENSPEALLEGSEN